MIDAAILLLTALSLVLTSTDASQAVLGAALGACGLAIWRVMQGRWQATPIAVLALGVVAAALVSGGAKAWPFQALGLLALVMCAAPFWLWPVPRLPRPNGAFAVGMRIAEVELQARRLQLYVWYPAIETPAKRSRPFHWRREAKAFAGAYRALGAPAFINDHLQVARTSTVEGAPVSSGSFPVVIFNHGGGLWPTQNFSLLQDLASRGYIVVSIARPGETAGIAWVDGSETLVDRSSLAMLGGGKESSEAHALFFLSRTQEEQRLRLADLRKFVRDTLESQTLRWARESVAVIDLLSDGPPPVLAEVAANMDFSRRAYVGMSLGGAVATECCFIDPSAKAGVNLDGMNWAFERIDTNIPTPFLQIYGDQGLALKNIGRHLGLRTAAPSEGALAYNDIYYEAPEHRGERADVVRATLRGAAHMDFTDLTLAVRGPARPLVGLGPIEGGEAIDHVNTLCAAFLDCYMKGGDVNAIASALRLPKWERR